MIRKFGVGREIEISHEAGWKYVGFKSVELSSSNPVCYLSSSDCETFVVVITGCVNIDSEIVEICGEYSSRESVFPMSVGPLCVYLGLGDSLSISSKSAILGICTGRAHRRCPSKILQRYGAPLERRGEEGNLRTVRQLLAPDDDACTLLVSETFTPKGNWSSFPSHKHDIRIDGQETCLHETYFYLFEQDKGFAFQRVYGHDFDESFCLKSGETVALSKGFHPVSVSPNSNCYYLNVMGGEQRIWMVSYDD